MLNIFFDGEEALLMLIFLVCRNSKQNFLKLKLVMYIEMVGKMSDYIVKKFYLHFFMKMS